MITNTNEIMKLLRVPFKVYLQSPWGVYYFTTGLATSKEDARRLSEEAFPGWRVVGIDMD